MRTASLLMAVTALVPVAAHAFDPSRYGSPNFNAPNVDALIIQGLGSRGRIDGMSVAPGDAPTASFLKDILGRTVDVADFRGPLDGSDWGPAIGRALTKLQSAGGVMRISTPGTLTINTQVSFPKSGPDVLLRCDSWATVLTVGASLSAHMFAVGGASAPGRMPLGVEGCAFAGRSGAGSIFAMQNANAMTFRRLKFTSMGTAITSAHGYAVTLEDVMSDGVQSLFYSSTAAHNFVGRRIKAYGGGTTIRFDGVTDNASIVESDFEIIGTALQMAGGTALRFVGNYVEYMANDPVYSSAPLYGTDFSNNWVALGRSNWNVVNWVGGQIKGNAIYSQSVTFGAGTVDVEVGDNTVTGGVQTTNPTGSSSYATLAGAIPPSPYQAPTLANAWTQQANYSPAGFRKGRDGRVYLRGNLLNSTAALGTAAFTLPVGYRPGSVRTFSTSNSANGLSAIQIAPDGTVKIMQTSGAGASGNPYQAGLDGISFEPGA